jgi:hypothetical protein
MNGKEIGSARPVQDESVRTAQHITVTTKELIKNNFF